MLNWWKRTKANPTISFGCPTLAELISLYADLSEPANWRTLQEMINNVEQDPDHNPLVIARAADKSLMGFLLGWTDGSGQGIVYDIAIHPKHQGQEVAKGMLKFLVEQKPGAWKGSSQRISPNLDRHLVVVRTMYAVALAFGFQKVVDASYIQFLHDFSAPAANLAVLPASSSILLFLLFCAIGLLGIRFFWATGNIRRFLLQRVIVLKPPRTRDLLLGHFPALILHAVLFFFLCRFYQDICLTGVESPYVFGLAGVFTALMLLNCVWLSVLRRKRTDPGPERIWIANNGLFAVLGAVYLIAFPRFEACPEIALSIALALFLINSAVDLLLSGHSYILGDAFGGG